MTDTSTTTDSTILATESGAEAAILLLSCVDQKGIVASVTQFISSNGGNIINLHEHVDNKECMLLMRVEWDLGQFAIGQAEIHAAFTPIAERFAMSWSLHFSNHVPRMAIFVSREAQCLYDILARYQTGEWQVEIPLIISNHSFLESIANTFGIEYHVFPITKQTKQEQEQKEIALLRRSGVDLIVLARYMQILSDGFVDAYPNQIINIHHSFLPAFPGAKPYHSAHQRGVKIIGATSHYVTAALDEGPIIEQDITRVSHRDSVADFIRKGKDLEKVVLARAIGYHLQHRILAYRNRTVVFA